MPGSCSAARIAAAQTGSRSSRCSSRIARRDLHRDETVPLGEGRETESLGEALGAGRAAAVLLARRLSGLEPAGPDRKREILARDLQRGHNWLIQNARIFVGNGKVIESGAVLVRNRARSPRFTRATAPDAKTLNAEPIEAAGKTVLPGLDRRACPSRRPAAVSTTIWRNTIRQKLPSARWSPIFTAASPRCAARAIASTTC